MVARLDWLNNGIEQMLKDNRPLTPEERGQANEVRARDVDMLRCAAALKSLRTGANSPSDDFVAGLRARMLAAASGQSEAGQ